MTAHYPAFTGIKMIKRGCHTAPLQDYGIDDFIQCDLSGIYLLDFWNVIRAIL